MWGQALCPHNFFPHMPKTFSMIDVVRSLTELGERQFAKETAAAKYLQRILRDTDTPFTLQPFVTHVPRIIRATLTADGASIATYATSFVGGDINDAHGLLSSLLPPEHSSRDANINFNPASNVISRSNHYFAPSLAIARGDVSAVLAAKKVHGEVRVKRQRHNSMNILVGNRRTPKHIFICHYDSLGPGATDNAAGVATLLALAIKTPELLAHTLLVFSGNEELSYDEPYYWGHGYRVFARAYARTLTSCSTIAVVDCVGNGKTTIDRSPDMLKLALPIPSLNRLLPKVVAIYGSSEKLFHVYHSAADTIDQVEERHLKNALQTCQNIART